VLLCIRSQTLARGKPNGLNLVYTNCPSSGAGKKPLCEFEGDARRPFQCKCLVYTGLLRVNISYTIDSTTAAGAMRSKWRISGRKGLTSPT